jgi:hypothetical protein
MNVVVVGSRLCFRKTGRKYGRFSGYRIHEPYRKYGKCNSKQTPDLYREITLNLPTTARVTSQITPSIHILADFNQYLSGETPLLLSSANDMMMGSSQHLVNVTNNLIKMFKVDHVHND